MHALTDETYSLLTAQVSIDKSHAFALSVLNHGYWITGTLLGALLASLLEPIEGIEFVLVLVVLFWVLLIEHIKAHRHHLPPLLALGASVAR